jgi:signal transduction histidine kinase
MSEKRQLRVSLQTDGTETRLSQDVELCLYRVAQEALNNVIKHSHAQEVNVQTGRFGDVFRLMVRDTGVGFDPATAAQGLGLVGMRERLRTIGGDLQVKSSSLAGTEVTAEVTAPEQAASAHT